jgi:hypothetical protein
MARAGRPPKPLEQHKRTGTFNPTRHGQKSALAVVVEPVDRAPFELTAAEAFAAVMQDGVAWLARTDAPSLALLRSMLEEREDLREAAVAGSTEARKMLRDLDKQVMSLLSQLGFDPASRSRLGLAEVKTQSKLEELRARQTR